jgi:PAS domain S-box-containing protein
MPFRFLRETRGDMPTQDDAAPETRIEQLLGSEELVEAVENEHFRQLLDGVPVGIAIARLVKGRERIVYANAAFAAATGCAPSELEGREWSTFDDFRHEDVEAVTLGSAIAQGEDFLGTFRRDRVDAPVVALQAYVGVVETHDGSEACRILAIIDVSSRERGQRDELERRIRDKDLLLRELQHRVKNNLQLITALIRLEARTVQPEERKALARLASRVEALALLYQTLSADNFRGEVDLGSYLSEIAAAVVRAHTVPGIELELKIAYLPASVNVAMPAGLLINEMLTNAFKHAFTGRPGGTISVECQLAADGRFRIVVADDGVGMPPDSTWPERGKLSALIIQTLRENTAQMSLEIASKPGLGTRVSVAFVDRAGTKVH